MWNLYFMFEILASYNLFILDASMNLSSMMTCFIASPNKSDRSFTPHLLNHFIMAITHPCERKKERNVGTYFKSPICI